MGVFLVIKEINFSKLMIGYLSIEPTSFHQLKIPVRCLLGMVLLLGFLHWLKDSFFLNPLLSWWLFIALLTPWTWLLSPRSLDWSAVSHPSQEAILVRHESATKCLSFDLLRPRSTRHSGNSSRHPKSTRIRSHLWPQWLIGCTTRLMEKLNSMGRLWHLGPGTRSHYVK